MDVWVYLPGERYARGRIGYGKFRMNSRQTGENSFMVYSRKIQNAKYTPERDQFHMAITSKYENALRSARASLVAYSPLETAGREHSTLTRRIQVLRDEVMYAPRRMVRDMEASALLMEFTALIDSGYKFSDSIFHKRVLEMVEAEKLAKQKANDVCHAYHVSIRQVGDEQYADITEAFEVGSGGQWAEPKYGGTITVLVQDIPYDIAGKLAVLSMNEADHYVEGVGIKVDDTAFWVQRDIEQS